MLICAATLLVACVSGAGLFAWQELSASKHAKALHGGQIVVIVESKDAYDEANGTVRVGTGIGGTLGLVGGSCVGFVDQGTSNSGPDRVIVWPPGTTVSGSGTALRITSEGKTVQLGDQIEAGADLRRTFPELDGTVPTECRDFPRVPVGLNS